MAVICKFCEKIFSSQSCLNRHVRKTHKIKEKQIVSYDWNIYNSKCFDCKCSFIQTVDLRNHLINVHNIKLETEELQFDSIVGKHFFIY